MKKILFILSLICFLSCEETKLMNDNKQSNKNFIKKINDTVPLLDLEKKNDRYNGYNKKECVDGEDSEKEQFYKLVFLTSNASYVTKYAYLIKQPNDDFEKKYYCIPISERDKTDNFINSLNNFFSENDFFSFYNSTEYGYHISPGDIIWIYNTKSVLLLKKNEYENYMKENPNTIIMNC